MPLLVLGAETCPPHIEATLYSCLMSTINVGSLLSTYFGALFTSVKCSPRPRDSGINSGTQPPAKPEG